jgi:2-methylcitrate dehydratase PrpD
MEETKALAEFTRKLKYEDLPKEVTKKTKQLILDQLGCQAAGSTLPWSKRAYEFVVDYKNAREESTIINYGVRTSAQDAAFVNASFGHAFLGDDADSVCHAHFGSIIVPAALAVGEREMINGKEFIRAVVVGYEVASRMGAAAPLAMSRGFHPGPIFGTFGVAAAVATILGLDEKQGLDALGIAASHSSGLMEYSLSGGTVNRLHSGIAAHGGIRAALLAQRGFKGPAAIVEGERGFLRAFSGECQPEEITGALGSMFRVLSIELKAHCCCGSSSAILDAVSEIKSEHTIHPDEVEEIIVKVSQETFKLTGSIVEPSDITSAQFSGRFGVALRLIKGGNTFKEYSEENLKDRNVLALARKTTMLLDEEMEILPNSNNPARVVIRLKKGTLYEKTIPAARGSILNPMTEEEVRQKFREFSSVVLPESRAEAIIDTVSRLDSLENIGQLTQLLVVGRS